jgi:hypothetical protein
MEEDYDYAIKNALPLPWSHFHRAGDIVLVAEHTRQSRYIRAWQAIVRLPIVLKQRRYPHYSHCLICILPGLYVHSDFPGVNLVLADEEQVSSNPHFHVKRSTKLSKDPEAIAQVSSTAFYHLKKGYNLRFNFSRLSRKHYESHAFCSQLVSHVYEKLGISFGRSPSSVLPFDIELTLDNSSDWEDVTTNYRMADDLFRRGLINAHDLTDMRILMMSAWKTFLESIITRRQIHSDFDELKNILTDDEIFDRAVREQAAKAPPYDAVEAFAMAADSLRGMLEYRPKPRRTNEPYERVNWADVDPNEIADRADQIHAANIRRSNLMLSNIEHLAENERTRLISIANTVSTILNKDTSPKDGATARAALQGMISEVEQIQPRSGSEAREALVEKTRALRDLLHNSNPDESSKERDQAIVYLTNEISGLALAMSTLYDSNRLKWFLSLEPNEITDDLRRAFKTMEVALGGDAQC